MKKVLMVLTTSFGKSGIGNVVKNYTFTLHDRIQFDFFICRGIDEDNKKYVKSINGKIITPKCNREKEPVRYIIEFVSLVKKLKYDVVHIHGNSCTMFFDALASRLSGIKIVIAHSHSTYTDYPLIHRMLKPFFNMLISRGLACSDEAGEWCFYKYSILNNAIDSKRFIFSDFNRNKLRKQLKICNDEFVLLNVGHLDKCKNQAFIIDLVHKIKKSYGISLKFYIVGQGNLKEALEEQIENKELCENVFLIGETNDVELYYSMADCFVLPSLYEGLGIVLLEAQAAGLHCIASKGVPEQSNLCGIVEYISLKNEEAWIRAIIEQYTHNVDRKKESIRCCEDIKQKKYDISVVAEDLLAVYT